MQQGKIETEVGIASLTDLINNSKIAEIADKKFTLKDVATDWHNAWVSMTEEVNAGPLVAAFRDFVSIFSDGSESAKGLKEGITGAVDSIIKWLAAGVEAAGIFVMKLETGFYEAEVSMAPLVKDIKQFSTDANVLEELGEFAKRFGRYMGEAAIATAFLVTEGLKLSDWWRHEFDKVALAAIGRGASGGFIHGLIEGLKDGVGEVVKAAKDVANAAAHAVKDALGIHSPSEVMRGLGMQTTEGFELGMTQPGPEDAMREAYAPPPVQPAARAGSGDRTFDFSGMHIEITSGAAASDIIPLLESQLADALERAANEAGA